MKQAVKQEWIKRILEQQNIPAVERVPAEFILNALYMEMTGKQLRYPNSYNIRDEHGNIPEYISVGTRDRINRDVMKWAFMEAQDPKLPSYGSIGGIVLATSFQVLSAIQSLGLIEISIEKRTGIGKVETKKLRRKISISEVARLIELDL